MSHSPFLRPFVFLRPFLLLALLTLPSVTFGQTEPPVMTQDPVGYLHYLETSNDPAAAAVRRQIDAGPADLAAARETAQKAGMPLTPADLTRPMPPEGENAAPLYAKLHQLLKDKPLDLPNYAQPLGYSRSYTPAQIAAVRKIYESRSDVWTLLHQAADRPQCVFARDWSQGPALLFTEYSWFREAARLLNTETYLLAASGQYDAAIKNEARGFRIARHASSDPILISYLVAVAIDSITLSGMQSVLDIAGPNADVAVQVRTVIEKDGPHLSLRYALGGENAGFQSVALEQTRTGVKQEGLAAAVAGFVSRDDPLLSKLREKGPGTAEDKRFLLNWLDASEVIILNRMRVLYAAADLPPMERRPVFQAEPAPVPAPLNLLPDMLLPTYSRMDESATRMQAKAAVSIAGAAILAEWAKMGHPPDTLPETFLDPYTGKPLRYHTEGRNGQVQGKDGFVVYSVGPTGGFGGGMAGKPLAGGETAFRYPVSKTPASDTP